MLFKSSGKIFWHQQSRRRTSISLTLKSTPKSPPPGFLRTPKPSLRRFRRKNNFGVFRRLYVGVICCPHIVDRLVCIFWPLVKKEKPVISRLPRPPTPNRPPTSKTWLKRLENEGVSVGCFCNFFAHLGVSTSGRNRSLREHNRWSEQRRNRGHQLDEGR